MHLCVEMVQKRCLKCMKKFSRFGNGKSTWNVFFAWVIFKYEKNDFELIYIFCNFFTLSILPEGHKNTFFPFKRMMIFLNGNYFFLFLFLTPDAALPIIFLIYLFLMAAFRHFSLRECHKREFTRCLSLARVFFLFRLLCINIRDFVFHLFIFFSIELIWKHFFF